MDELRDLPPCDFHQQFLGAVTMQEQQHPIATDTELLHAFRQESDFMGATSVPLFQTSAFAAETAEDLEAVFHNKKPGFAYSRIGNPTVNYFEQKMARLEGGMFATACASGSAAVSLTLLNILKSGDEIIVPTGLYGGTLDLFRDLQPFGITAVFVDEYTPEAIAPLVNEHTKALFAEVIGNPKLNVVDLQPIAELAHAHGIPFLVDSTTATPALIRPISFGADIVIHSSSKYINSNGSAISGVIVDSGKFPWTHEKFDVMGEYLKFGKGAFTARLRNCIWRDIGACCAPMNAYLNLNGIETLGLRMERICNNALTLAEYLCNCEEVKAVGYPGLKSNPYFDLACRQFKNGYGGGILTIRVGSKEKAFRVINRLKYALNVSNIGDTKTLVVHPASTIFAHSSERQKAAAGVYDDLIRVSVGIEDISDIVADFTQALKEES